MHDLRLLFARICILLDKTPSRSLLDLSREFQVGPNAIQKAVASMTNRSFTKFKDDVLMAKLTRLLIARPMASVKEMAFDLGYKSVPSFDWHVRRASGVSPARLRLRIAGEMAAQYCPEQIPEQGQVAWLHC